MRSYRFLTFLALGAASLAAHADTLSTFDITGTSVFYGLANDTNTVSGTAVIDVTTGIVQNIFFTVGGIYESGVDSQQGVIVYVGADQDKISFDAGSLIGYNGSAFDLNGHSDLYVGHGIMAAAPPVPEPCSLILLTTGLLGSAGMLRRRRV